MDNRSLFHVDFRWGSLFVVTPAPFVFQEIILSIHLIPRMNAMLDFIRMGPVYLPGARRKRQIQNEKFLPTRELEPIILRFVALCSTDLASRALMKAVLLELLLNIHVLPIPRYQIPVSSIGRASSYTSHGCVFESHNFSFCILSLWTHSWQVHWSNTN